MERRVWSWRVFTWNHGASGCRGATPPQQEGPRVGVVCESLFILMALWYVVAVIMESL